MYFDSAPNVLWNLFVVALIRGRQNHVLELLAFCREQFFTDAAQAPLTAINYHALEALKEVAGLDVFVEAVKRNKSFNMFDKVNGTDATRLALQAGTPAAEIVASWKAGEEKFRQDRAKYLLY